MINPLLSVRMFILCVDLTPKLEFHKKCPPLNYEYTAKQVEL
jgi:hypothetical protein